MKTQTGYSITQPTAKQFLAAVIHNHGAKVTLPLDPEDDQGAIVWFDSLETCLLVANRLGSMVELFDGTAVYVHEQYVAALFD